ncbi:MAG: glycosyltransferase [Xenococcaceae cyanobacterium MO_167.B27]|nr:glycosyltransferase [Xenococcaceae cyanobacterium MO_167.B27]
MFSLDKYIQDSVSLVNLFFFELMTHFALVCPAERGHLNTMLPLGQELQRRGHRVTFFGMLDAESNIEAAKLEFIPIGEQEFPRGSMNKMWAKQGELTGIPAILNTIECIKKTAVIFLNHAPKILKENNVEALIVDQIAPEGGTVAEYLNLPFITLCSALPFNQEANVPPFFTDWQYNPTFWNRWRNRIAYQSGNPFAQPIKNLRLKYRQKWQLPSEQSPDSPLAILSHQPAEFEFPRQDLPQWFHFTGPYHNQTSRKPVSFPWEKLTGQALIYASMGTLQNRQVDVFEKIAAACAGLEAQLVISLGGAKTPESLPKLPGSPLVVGYAPQLELLQKAALVITHAGMNTTLESLTYGVPIVAIPVTNDQFGISARVVWTGTGEAVPRNKLSTSKLEKLVRKVLIEDSYKKNALKLKQAIKQAGGVSRAADIVEKAVSTKDPVYR